MSFQSPKRTFPSLTTEAGITPVNGPSKVTLTLVFFSAFAINWIISCAFIFVAVMGPLLTLCNAYYSTKKDFKIEVSTIKRRKIHFLLSLFQQIEKS